MGFRLPGIVHFKKNQAPSKASDVPKGYFAVYVGDSQNKRFVIPLSYLNQPLFQDLLSRAEEEFGYDHPMGAITIPCSKDSFLDLISRFGINFCILEEMESLAELKEGRGLIIQRMISQGMSWKKTFDNSLAGRSNCLRGEDQKASPSSHMFTEPMNLIDIISGFSIFNPM
ncbi:hypothetical protein CerSpe_276260 [Prunus speciosa]